MQVVGNLDSKVVLEALIRGVEYMLRMSLASSNRGIIPPFLVSGARCTPCSHSTLPVSSLDALPSIREASGQSFPLREVWGFQIASLGLPGSSGQNGRAYQTSRVLVSSTLAANLLTYGRGSLSSASSQNPCHEARIVTFKKRCSSHCSAASNASMNVHRA